MSVDPHIKAEGQTELDQGQIIIKSSTKVPVSWYFSCMLKKVYKSNMIVE